MTKASQLDAEIAEVLRTGKSTFNTLVDRIEKAVDAHPELTRQRHDKRGIETAELIFRDGAWSAEVRLRHDAPDHFADRATARVAATAELGGGFRAAASWGQGFKTPTISQFLCDFCFTPAEPLSPETAEGWDMTLGWGSGDGRQRASVTVYRLDVKDQIAYVAGHYENMFSCNPIWEPMFSDFPEHPITRGVKPFTIKDEWYFNMRFINDVPGNQPATLEEIKFTPILVAVPSDAVRNGPYVYPKGPYAHIQANKGRAEAMMWAVERPDHGRGFGFTGGHFHDNWSNDQFRKVVLNACVRLTGAEVPEGCIESQLAPGQIDQNLDPKPKR